jgi:hypothetical protein
MRRFAVVMAGVLAIAGLSVSLAGSASAATTIPVVSGRETGHWAEGGVSPDTWHTHIDVAVSGYNFTPGADVAVQFWDTTAGGATFGKHWLKAGTGPCGPECNNAGKIYLATTLEFPYRAVCGHTFEVAAYDTVKGPQLSWQHSTFTVSC